MFDTIHLWLPSEVVGNKSITNLSDGLSSVTEHYKDDGQTYITGILGNNIRVSISGRGVSIKGSLSKYYLPDNLHTLTKSDTARALEKISDETKLSILDAGVSRFDIAHNLSMQNKPEAYYPFLGECRYYKRSTIDKSLYYSNSRRKKVFYNKTSEAKAKGVLIPEIWRNKNILRYEVRFTKQLSKQFNQSDIKASTLINNNFYKLLLDQWVKEYEVIEKIKNINFNLSNMNSPKDFWRQMSLFAIKSIGQDKILQEIENLRTMNTFSNPEYYSRLKKEIRKLCNNQDISADSELVTELDRKIKNTNRYYR